MIWSPSVLYLVHDGYHHPDKGNKSINLSLPKKQKSQAENYSSHTWSCLSGLCWQSMRHEKDIFSTFIVFIEDWALNDRMLDG
jgi:hypothetical protein